MMQQSSLAGDCNCKLPTGQLQVYHKYKVLATNFLEKSAIACCIKSEHLVYRKRTASYFHQSLIASESKTSGSGIFIT